MVIYEAPRGSPQNVGRELAAVHPVVRTNPVTGWKSIFAVGSFPKRINELDPEESAELLQRFYRVILDNHDVTVRFKWRNENDIGECGTGLGREAWTNSSFLISPPAYFPFVVVEDAVVLRLTMCVCV